MDVKQFAGDFADEMVAVAPQPYVATMTKANGRGRSSLITSTTITRPRPSPTMMSARPGAPVAVPLSRDELKGLKSANAFAMKDVLKRLKHRKPPAPPTGQTLHT